MTVVQWLLARGWQWDKDGEARHRLSAWMTGAIIATVVASAVALADSLGQTLYARFAIAKEFHPTGIAAFLASTFAASASAVGSAHQILAKLAPASGPGKKGGSTWLMSAGALAAALVLAAIGVSLASFVSHLLFWRGGLPIEVARDMGCLSQPVPDLDPAKLVGWCAGSFVLVLRIAQFAGFVNQSSLSSFYAARLTRAYLGASNPERIAAAHSDGSVVEDKQVPFLLRKVFPEWSKELDTARALSKVEPVPGDQVRIDTYFPHDNGGPLHLINVTLNETVDARSQIHERDRHGLPMALGPMAMSVGVHHHAKRVAPPTEEKRKDEESRFLYLERAGAPPEPNDKRFRIFPFPDGRPVRAERMELGEWMAVSGAAVAPGMGSRTRLGTSLLLGMFNIRLGHWWRSGIAPKDRRFATRTLGILLWVERVVSYLFPVYAFLTYELLARFPGTANKHWYLTDGGHFENTGCYELIRRRLPLIICFDNGADPKYLFADIANLVRLARVDFGAEIEFLDDLELSGVLTADAYARIGTLEQLQSAEWREESQARHVHAALATITYAGDDKPSGVLLVIKPTVCGDEPQDVRQYKTAHDKFPQESTADQFFGEAQWEAYRCLGDHIASELFRKSATATKWEPVTLDPDALLAAVDARKPRPPPIPVPPVPNPPPIVVPVAPAS